MTKRRRQTALSFVVLALAGYGGGGVSEVGQPDRPPAAVTLNVPSNATETSLTLSWSQSADSDFAAYKLHRAPSSGVGSSSTLVDSIATRTTLLTTASDLAASTTYFFRLYVCDAGGLCSGSNEVSGRTIMDNPWITIPSGEFVMGCADADAKCFPDESPKHTVYLSAYKIQKYEATNAQYKQCVDADACSAPFDSNSYTRTSYYGNPDYDDFPVISVDWFQSTAYCEWIGGRLPTETEWEKAARGPSPRENIHPWGDELDGEKANFCDANCPFYWKDGAWNDGYADTSPVGIYPSGAGYYGVMDIAGNVWEWVNDWYDSTYYLSSPSSDPQGPTTGSYRVLRGGSWSANSRLLRTSYRLWDNPSYGHYECGFRCAQDF